MITLLFLISTSLFIEQRAAAACECVDATISEGREWADMIFAGEVKHVEQSNGSEQNGIGSLVTFRVADVWKGAPRRTTKIFILARDISCTGTVIQPGDRFIVYARQSAKKIATASTCIRTRNLKNAKEDIKILGKSKFPEK
jgi:hypothetical protein